MPSDPRESLDAVATAAALPYPALADEIGALLLDDSVTVPPRMVVPLPGGSTLFAMPAADRRLAITKLITYVPANAGRGLPAIQGDVVVFDGSTGQRIAILDGPAVTARRTAAVSLLAARHLAVNPQGPLLVVGAGVQGRAHLEAFAAGLGVQEAWIASRSEASAQALAAHGRALGLRTQVVADANAALARCPLVVSGTPSREVVLHAVPRPDAFIAAVGAFTPQMAEWSPEVCRHVAAEGSIVVDSRDADHEAGDLLQAGLDVAVMPALADVVRSSAQSAPSARAAHRAAAAPVFFKSCGWAGWDLAAARLVIRGR